MVKLSVVIAGIVLAIASTASAATILDTNFDNANGIYNSGDTINATRAAIEQVQVKLSDNTALTVESGKVLFTDNTKAGNSVDIGPSLVKTFGAIPATSKTDSHLTIQFKVKNLLSDTANRPAMQIYISDNSGALAFQLQINSAGNIYCQNGTGKYESTFLRTDTEYSVKVDLDMTANTWGILVTDSNNGKFFEQPTILTRLTDTNMAKFQATALVINGGSHTNNVNASPYVQLDDLSLTSGPSATVPEPAAVSVLSLGALALLARRSAR